MYMQSDLYQIYFAKSVLSINVILFLLCSMLVLKIYYQNKQHNNKYFELCTIFLYLLNVEMDINW